MPSQLYVDNISGNNQTLNVNAGIITASSFVGNLNGTATYATNAGVATYSNTSGIATYATNAGIATYSDTSGIATYATNAGIATYSDTAGISTSVIGGIGSVTNLTVSGISTLGVTSTTVLTSQSINVSGVTTSLGGFISVANTTPVKITIENGLLVFSAVGIGSTSFVLA